MLEFHQEYHEKHFLNSDIVQFGTSLNLDYENGGEIESRDDESQGLIYVAGYLAKKHPNEEPKLGFFDRELVPPQAKRKESWFLDCLNRGGLHYPSEAFFNDIKKMNAFFKRYHPYNGLKEEPYLVNKFAEFLKIEFPHYDKAVLLSFSTLRTKIRKNLINTLPFSAKQITLHGQLKNVEYSHNH